MEENVIKFLPLILVSISLIVWLVRLEGKVKSNIKDIETLKTDNKEETKEINTKLDTLTTKITDLCISFAELSGYMKREREEKC